MENVFDIDCRLKQIQQNGYLIDKIKVEIRKKHVNL